MPAYVGLNRFRDSSGSSTQRLFQKALGFDDCFQPIVQRPCTIRGPLRHQFQRLRALCFAEIQKRVQFSFYNRRLGHGLEALVRWFPIPIALLHARFLRGDSVLDTLVLGVVRAHWPTPCAPGA